MTGQPTKILSGSNARSASVVANKSFSKDSDDSDTGAAGDKVVYPVSGGREGGIL